MNQSINILGEKIGDFSRTSMRTSNNLERETDKTITGFSFNKIFQISVTFITYLRFTPKTPEKSNGFLIGKEFVS